MDEVEFEFELLPFRKYKNGRFERLDGEEFVAPSDDLDGVSSKDVVMDPQTGLSARLYLPLAILDQESKIGDAKRLPILIYYHGGGFCVETPFSPLYHPYVNSLVSEGNILAVSVHYRRAPEHMLPVAYDDCYAALQWVLSHAAASEGPDSWIAAHGDLGRVYLAGDSAGANIAHNVAMRFGEEKFIKSGSAPDLEGIILVHPYFWGVEKLPEELEMVNPDWLPIVDKLWEIVSGLDVDHPWLNVTAEAAPCLRLLGCRRLLVAVTGKDGMKTRALRYYDKWEQSGRAAADAELWETQGEFHVFHLYNPSSSKSKALTDKILAFINRM